MRKILLSLLPMLVLLIIYPILNKNIIINMGIGFNFYLLFASVLTVLLTGRISDYRLYYRILAFFLLMALLGTLYPTFQVVEKGFIYSGAMYLFEIAILWGISYLILDISLFIIGKDIVSAEKIAKFKFFQKYLHIITTTIIMLGLFVTIFSDEEYFIEAMMIGWTIVLILSYRDFKNNTADILNNKKTNLSSAHTIAVIYGILLIFYGFVINEYIGGILFGGMIVVFSFLHVKFHNKFLKTTIFLISILSLIIFELERDYIDFSGEIMLLCVIFSIFMNRTRKYANID